MTVIAVEPPFKVFTDRDGLPVENGYIYIGVANQDAEAYPVSVYFDADATMPATQPIRTLGGVPQNNGAAATIFASGDYSIKVRSKDGSLVYSAPSNADVVNPGEISIAATFGTVALLLADTLMGYSAAGTAKTVAAGDYVEAGGYRYRVAASGASDHHVITANSVKLYVDPADGWAVADAFGVNTTPGTTDMGAAINAALAAFTKVRLLSATYYCGETIELEAYGAELCSADDTILSMANTSGPGVWLKHNRQHLKGIIVNAVGARAAVAAVDVTKPGVKIGGTGRIGQATGCHLDNVTCQFHPGAGFLNTLAGPNLQMDRCAANYNWGSGYFSDDGTQEGASTQRNGIVSLVNFRAQENGGNGIQLAPSGGTSYRYRITEYEGISNAWDYVNQSLVNAECDVRGQNVLFTLCGFGDTYYAQDTTQGGTGRVAKAAMSMGINWGSGCKNVGDDFCRFVTTGVNATLTSTDGYRSRGAYVDPTKVSGWVVGAGCSDVFIEVTDSTYYTTMVTATPSGVRGLVDGYEVVWTGAYPIYRNRVQSGTITSGSLNCTADVMNVAGEGGVADNLDTLVRAGGSVAIPAGQKITVLCKQAGTITVKHGVGNIYTFSGADIAVTQNKAATFVSDGTNIFEC